MASKEPAVVVKPYRPWSTVPAVDHERTTDHRDAVAHRADRSRPGLAT
jgi:hypothetical protein